MSELPSGWATATLEEISGVGGHVSDGDWIESKDQDPEGSVRLIQLMDVGDGHFTNRSSRFLNEEAAERLRCTKLRAGDVLIARMPDPLGRACVFPGVGQEAVTAVDVLIWRAGEGGAAPEWLKYAVNSPNVRDDLALKAGGTTRQRVAGGVLKKLELPVPPLAEQRRIVVKLDVLTARTARARADLDRIPALATRYKQAVLAKAFSGELTAALKVSASELLAGAFSAEEISGRSPAVGDLPDGWLWTSVGALTAVTGGLTKNSKRAAAPLQVSYLRVANVYADELRLGDVAMIGCTEREFEKTRLQRGDLLIVEGNGSLEQVGRTAIWNDELEACSHQNHLIRLRAAKQLIPRYLLLWLSSPAGRVAIEGVASSSSGLHTLSVSKVKGLPLPLCSLDEQKVIVDWIDRAFAEVDRFVTEAASARRLLNRLDQAVLARAFQGELVPQDPADEPASVLLDRIRAERASAPRANRGRRKASA